jgi:FdhE protein
MGTPDLASPWAAHAARARVLLARYPFAAQVLSFYLGLVETWQDGYELALAQAPPPAELASWATQHVTARVAKLSEASGPAQLGEAVRELVDSGGSEAVLSTWLAGGQLDPVARFLARASLHPPLVALAADAAAACAADAAPRDERHCPRCGGLPQLSYRNPVEDRLVSGSRQLLCARCGLSWAYSATSCPSCGETTGAKRTVYAEQRAGPVIGRAEPAEVARATEPGIEPASPPLFAHLRIDSCATCQRYVIDVDLGSDPHAVAEVDELAALPLNLHAAELGLAKITPNLMGF